MSSSTPYKTSSALPLPTASALSEKCKDKSSTCTAFAHMAYGSLRRSPQFISQPKRRMGGPAPPLGRRGGRRRRHILVTWGKSWSKWVGTLFMQTENGQDRYHVSGPGCDLDFNFWCRSPSSHVEFLKSWLQNSCYKLDLWMAAIFSYLPFFLLAATLNTWALGVSLSCICWQLIC